MEKLFVEKAIEWIDKTDIDDPISVRKAIEYINVAVKNSSLNENEIALLSFYRIFFWLKLWDIEKDFQSLIYAVEQFEHNYRKEKLIFQDVIGLEKIYFIFIQLWEETEDANYLDDVIKYGNLLIKLNVAPLPNYYINLKILSDNQKQLCAMGPEGEKIINNIRVMDAKSNNHKNPLHFYNLALSLNKRYQLNGAKEDLFNCINLLEEVIVLIPEAHLSLNNLAAAYGQRYELLGNSEDVEKSIELMEKVFAIRPNDPNAMNNLANAIGQRYSISGELKDLYRCIDLMDLAVQLDPENPVYKITLANAIGDRFKLYGVENDLEKQIMLLEQAYEKEPENPAYMNNLSTSLGKRYELKGDIEDMERAIELLETALKKLPDSPSYLNNLANAIGKRYELKGYEKDLDRKIALHEKAVKLKPNDPYFLSNFALSLGDRFWLKGNVEDVSRQIELMKKATNLKPNDPFLINNLADAYQNQYSTYDNFDDLKKQITLLRKALQMEPEHPGLMGNLSRALGELYKKTGDIKTLKEQVELVTQAMKNNPKDPGMMANMIMALINRFNKTGVKDNFYEAVNLLHEAIQLLPKGHKHMPLFFRNLGALYYHESRFEEALSYFESMATTLEALRGLRTSRKVRQKMSEEYAEFYARLVVCCLELGQPEKALRYIEAAKSRALVDALHNQVADLSKLVTDDPVVRDNLANLQKIQAEINYLLKQLGTSDLDTGWIDPEEIRSRRPVEEINAELEQKRKEEDRLWNQLEIHAPVFAMTISAPPFTLEDAQELTKQENATLISYYRSAQGLLAFVVDQESFVFQRLVKLDQKIDLVMARYQKSIRAIDRPLGQTLMSYVLEEAWDLLIKPLCDYLPEHGSNLIIAPFGELHLLPFVAFKDRETGDCLIDRYQVKVVTSLNTLKAMRAQANLPAEIQSNKAMTVVAYPGADNPNEYGYLRGVEIEAEEILKLYQNDAVALTKSEATTMNTLENAVGSEKLHFACHGMFNPIDPYRSGLKLKDAWLTVRDITTRMNLSGTELVVMSSCLSGFSGVSKGEELTGLLTAFIASRAKAVVGSLWSVDDKSTARFMIEFYKNLENGKPKVEALRDAQLYIRKQIQWSHPYYWAPFFITGVD